MSSKLKTSFLFSGLIATPFFILEEIHPSMCWTGVLYVLDWCVVSTGLVCCMYWTGVLSVLDWCVLCTGLVCCMYWTGHTSPIHQLSTYNSPVQHTSPVHIIHFMYCVVCTQLVCCMRVGGGGGGEGGRG